MQSDPLSAPLTLPCGVRLNNRIAKAAVCEGLADAQLQPTHAHERLYRRWAESGPGLLVSGAVEVDHHALRQAGNVLIDDDTRHDALVRWAAAGSTAGNAFWLQLAHARGNRATWPRWRRSAPSANTDQALAARFAQAAQTAAAAGFGGIQIGLSGNSQAGALAAPRSHSQDNHQGTAWPASLLLAILRAVRAAVPPGFAVGIRLNTADVHARDQGEKHYRQLMQQLNGLGVDLLELVLPTQAAHRARAVDCVLPIRAAATLPLMLTGGFRSREDMLAALAADHCDMIGLARPFCADPRFARRLLEGTESAVPDFNVGLAWYRVQLARIGRGLEPDWHLRPAQARLLQWLQRLRRTSHGAGDKD